MLLTPQIILYIRVHSYFRKISQQNSNKILKNFTIFILIFHISQKKKKKFIIESNHNDEIYFIFLNKYLSFVLEFRLWVFYLMSDKESNFSLNNKDKLGIENIIGTSYFFNNKKNPYLYLNINCCSIDWRIVSCKFKDFCCDFKFSICLLNIDLYQAFFIFKKSIYEKKNKLYICINKNLKPIQRKKIIWVLNRKKNAILNIKFHQNYFLVKGFLKKDRQFLFQFYRKFHNFKLNNSKISSFVKKNFDFYSIDLSSKDFIFEDNTISDIKSNNYFVIEQFLTWKGNCIARISNEEGKSNNFLASLSSFFLFSRYSTTLPNKILSKIPTIVFFNSEFIIPLLKHNKKNKTYKWLKFSLFSSKKFRKYYYSEINITFHLVDKKIAIYDATINKKIIVENINGQVKIKDSINLSRNEEFECYAKSGLSEKKFNTIVTGNSTLYLNI
jgi:hypothetical protein